MCLIVPFVRDKVVKEMESLKIDGITEQKHPWLLEVDGQPVPFKERVLFTNPQHGVAVGLGVRHREGWVGPGIAEKGGVITIPYSFTNDGQLLVGLIQEKRPNLVSDAIENTMVFDAVGGMVDPGESHEQASSRETVEEAGFTVKLEELPGFTTWNRLYNYCELDTGRGVLKRYVMEIPFAELVRRESGEGYVFGPGALAKYKLNKTKEMPALVFFDWVRAAEITPDLIAHGGFIGLLAKLRREGRQF